MTDEIGDSIPSNGIHHGNETAISCSPKVEGGSNGNVVFSREAPLVSREDLSISTCSCEAEKLKSRLAASDSEPGKNEMKLSRQDRIELGRFFRVLVHMIGSSLGV
ncbi:unnamed protein product [Fraxinus pennsylvanica]|uniref:Uncharacterized protein n=1 Tax=Fraxinus pennsylvanica TaxID=56036 RepID=A0AAD1ZK17_9LAMI|nr:unnamed protein product [Fraxinus pennsylvanica]